MRKVLPLLSALLILGATTAVVGVQAKDWGPVPPHGHVMLIGAEIDGGQLFFDRCVEFAAGQTLSTTAHHASVHTGVAGGSPFVMGKLWEAGKIVAPLAPLTPWHGCEDLESGMFLP